MYICLMKKEQIENMIDKKIEKSLSEKETIFTINQELSRMSENIAKTLAKNEVSVEDYIGMDFDSIEPIRVRYVVHYVRHCRKRKSDLVWLLAKSIELRKTNPEMFKLLKFKEKMTC
jgi:hypothetical protein